MLECFVMFFCWCCLFLFVIGVFVLIVVFGVVVWWVFKQQVLMLLHMLGEIFVLVGAIVFYGFVMIVCLECW